MTKTVDLLSFNQELNQYFKETFSFLKDVENQLDKSLKAQANLAVKIGTLFL